MDPLLTGLGVGAAALAGYGVNAPELLRKTPGPMSAGASEDQLLNALDNYVKRTTNNPIDEIDRDVIPDKDITLGKFIKDSDQFASYQGGREGVNPGYAINLNADRGLLAHELGHVAFGQSPVGRKVQAIRRMPRLSNALEAAAILAPAGIALANDGDDELAVGAALATALAAPTLIDEFEGSRRGLAIMKDAGMTATPGQRGRMAGGLLSYMARPIALAAGGVALGNMFDDSRREEVELSMG